MKYRSEIDGLRAFAVLNVIFYHFFPSLNGMGYLGVDIFFIISGYLITTHLISLDSYSASTVLKIFYERRIKRIFPALFVFLFITTTVAFFILIITDLEKYFSSLIASKTFWANWYFWRDGGYFGSEDKLKPLLHLWSLSVEEQFYLLYPVFIILTFWVRSKLNLNILIPIIFLGMLSFSLWVFMHLIDGSNPAFFLLPTRAWQFALGAVISILHNRILFETKLYSNILFFMAFIFLILSVSWSYSQFLNTILVSLSASFFIFLKPKSDSKIAKLFRNFVAVFIGKISYSLYLYHWPIIVFLGYYYVNKPPLSITLLFLILSFIISFFSFKIIEKPFRHIFKFKHTIILIIFCTIANSCVYFISNLTYKNNLVSKWANASGKHFRCSPDTFIPFGASRGCILNDNKEKNNKVVLLGNSHAQMYSPLIINKLQKYDLTGLLVPLNGCLPTTTTNQSKSCIKKARQNLNKILEDNNIKTVLIASTWYSDNYITSEGNSVKQSDLITSFRDLISELKKARKNVILFSPIKIPEENIATNLPRLINFGWITKEIALTKTWSPRSNFDNEFLKINSYFSNFLGDKYIRVYNDLCDRERCYYAKKDLIYFADDHHLSRLALPELLNTSDQLDKIFSIIKKEFKN